MKIIVFNGSPRKKNSNTHIMVESFLEGACEIGAEYENIFLAEKNIGYCCGCMSCWIKTPGICGQNDDMKELLEKYNSADIIVYASPVYVGSVTAIMKTFLDRHLPLADPHLLVDENGNSYHPSRDQKNANIVLISNCGFAEQSHFKYYRTVFEYMFKNFNANVIAEIYRGEGELLKLDNILTRPVIENYKNLLKQAGREIINDLKLSEKTRIELEKPLVPYVMYNKFANMHWDKVIPCK